MQSSARATRLMDKTFHHHPNKHMSTIIW